MPDDLKARQRADEPAALRYLARIELTDVVTSLSMQAVVLGAAAQLVSDDNPALAERLRSIVDDLRVRR